MPVRDPDVQVTVAGDGARVVHLSGAWDIRALQSRAAALQSALRDAGPAQVSLWDLTQIQRFDHIGAMLVWRTWAGAGRAGCSSSASTRYFSARANRPKPSHPRRRRPTGFRCCSPSGGACGR